MAWCPTNLVMPEPKPEDSRIRWFRDSLQDLQNNPDWSPENLKDYVTDIAGAVEWVIEQLGNGRTDS